MFDEELAELLGQESDRGEKGNPPHELVVDRSYVLVLARRVA